MMQDAVLGATATKGQACPKQSVVSFCGNIWWSRLPCSSLIMPRPSFLASAQPPRLSTSLLEHLEFFSVTAFIPLSVPQAALLPY